MADIEKKTAFVVTSDNLSSNNMFTLIGSLAVLCCLIYCCISTTSSLASMMSNLGPRYGPRPRPPLHVHCTSNSQCSSGQICNTSTGVCQNSLGGDVTVKKTVVVPRPHYGYNHGYYY